MEELEKIVLAWCKERYILFPENIDNRSERLKEEVGEFTEEIMFECYDKAKIELGDVLFVLISMANMLGTDIKSCLKLAINKNKDRKGITKNGIFTRDDD